MITLNSLVYSNRPGIRILRHVIFWGVDLFNYFIVVYRPGEVPTNFIVLLFKFPLVILVTYFILYYLLPMVSRPGHRTTLLLWGLGLFLFLGLGMRLYKYFVVAPLIDPGHHIITEVGGFSRLIREIFESLAVISMAVAIKVFKGKVELEERNQQLDKEKRQAELNFLKAQMHPHFLFNTFNTLYSETIKNSGKAEAIILHLSSLMRFILEECNKPLIPLTREVVVIQDFIALEKLRHGDRLHVSFRTDGLNDRSQVSPLILLPFIENSFKHTVMTLRGDIWIDIHISLSVNQLTLSVSNDLVKDPSRLNGTKRGKGISNVKRQLDLIYGKDYSLVMDETASQFHVHLRIPNTLQESHA